MKVGFACAWWRPRESTWSYIPARLLHALTASDKLIVVPIDAQHSLPLSATLALVHTAPRANAWQCGRIDRRLTNARIQRVATRAGCDAVLAMGWTEPLLRQPTYFYQDMSYGVALEYRNAKGIRAPNLPRVSQNRLTELAAEESVRYRNSAGVFTMGRWFSTWLSEQGLVPPDRVHAVGGGTTSGGGGIKSSYTGQHRLLRREGSRERLLFVGRDFFRKGGDIVLAAVAELRAAGAGPYRLTVVGPPKWPLKGEPPPWVHFLGAVPPAGVGQLWERHDIFVMPSWFEAYGLVFLEARAAGLPCVARRAFAMPELVPEGRAGTLIDEDGESEDLAQAIHSVARNDALFHDTRRDAPLVAKDHSWEAVATRISQVITEGGKFRSG